MARCTKPGRLGSFDERGRTERQSYRHDEKPTTLFHGAFAISA
jgi:hypothetical protein